MGGITPMSFSVGKFKPKGYEHYLTTAELGIYCDRGARSIRRLRQQGRLPEGKRVAFGQLTVHLYSPAQAKECKRIIGEVQANIGKNMRKAKAT